jgi:hypothetical protein
MKLRPWYKIEVDNMTSKQARTLIKEKINLENLNFEVQSNEFYLHLYMPIEEKKLWTPYLAITIEEVEQGVVIRAHIGPAAKIWLPFVFFYTGISVAMLFVAIYGLSQISLNNSPKILFSLIPMVLLMGGMYLMSYLGQQKSSNCIIVFDRILRQAFEKHPNLTLFQFK